MLQLEENATEAIDITGPQPQCEGEDSRYL